MSLFRTILHPTDLSESSADAFHLACSLASIHHARLVVVYIVQTPVAAYVGGAPMLEPGSSLQEIQANMAELRPADPTVAVEHRVLYGEPAEQILRLAGDLNCDLIVLGTHGRSGLPRLVLGSVAEEVVRKACCPVLTVKARHRSVAEDPAAAGGARRMKVGTP